MELSTDLFSCVIQYEDSFNNKIITIEDILNYLENNDLIEDYYFILHDEKDKVPHFHLLIKLYKPRIKTRIIKDIAQSLLVNINIISVQPCHNFIKALRYLTHMDDPTKYQYSFEEVYSKTFGVYEETCKLSINPYHLTFADLYELVKNSPTRADVYASIGLDKATRYIRIIDELFKQKFDFEKDYK